MTILSALWKGKGGCARRAHDVADDRRLAVSSWRPPCGAARSNPTCHGGRCQRGEQEGRVRLITAEAVNEERAEEPVHAFVEPWLKRSTIARSVHVTLRK